jgi:16S rRNA (cytosine967-C5)-methyltransferase
MADKAIQSTLKSDKRWGSKDRAFIAENSYELVRWWRLFHYINESQLQQCDINTVWRLFGIKLILDKVDTSSIASFNKLNPAKIFKRYSEAQEIRKIKESIPDWLEEKGENELGDDWAPILSALNKTAPLSLRINSLKAETHQVQQLLGAEGINISKVKDIEYAAIVDERANVFNTKSFKDGLFEVQDIGSQLIAPYLDVKPGMRVIDACAGAGGKTLHLAALMENKGTIIALDTEQWKLEELKKRAKRNGAHNIDTRLVSGKTIKRLKESADAVLLDVPCSGIGVLKRNPDAKWKLTPDFIQEITNTQKEILHKYSNMTKPGGKLVYATCSIFPSENELQVKSFLEKNPNFKLIKENSTNVILDKCDGFYMALMQRI